MNLTMSIKINKIMVIKYGTNRGSTVLGEGKKEWSDDHMCKTLKRKT